mgnify:CR=1 FL=1
MTCLVKLLLCFLISVCAAGCATTQASDTHASDLVAVGLLKNRGYEALDEYGLNGRFTAELHVSRVISGSVSSRLLTVRYIAHDSLPEDRELRFHLRRSSDGAYLVCRDGGRGYTC